MEQINKGRRHELKMLKYKRRLNIYGLRKELQLSAVSNANLYAFRSHGAPCSCWACKGQKYKRNKVITYEHIDLSCESYKIPKLPPTFKISTPTDVEMIES